MANTVAGLVVSLGLNAVEYFQGLTKAEYQAKKFAQSFDREVAAAARVATSAFVLMEGAIIGAALAVDRLVKQASAFKDIEEKTGASAETLASFSVAAQVAGTTVDEVGKAMNKMAKNLAGVDAESTAAAKALQALGINVKEFKTLNPGQQMEVLAKAFSNFEDGANKSAAAMTIMGKAGAELLPFMKELATSGKTQILTQEQIDLADEYADAQKRAMASLNLYAQAAATLALPAIQGLTKAAEEFLKELLDVDKATGQLDAQKIRGYAEDGARAIAFIVDWIDTLVRALSAVGLTAGAGFAQLAAAAKFQFGEVYRIGKEWQGDMKRLLERPLFSTKLDAAFAQMREMDAMRRKEDRGFRPGRQVPDFGGAAGAGAGGRGARTQADRISDAERYLANLEQQLQKTQELTAQETLLADVEAGRFKVENAAQMARGLAITGQIDAAKAMEQAEKERVKLAAEEARTREQVARIKQRGLDDLNAETAALAQGNEQLRQEIEAIGLDATSMAQLTARRLEDAAAAKEQTAAMYRNQIGMEAEAAALEDQARLLRERKGILAQKGVAEQMAADVQKAKEINDLFVESFAEGARSIAQNATSIGDAVKRMGQRITDALLDIATKNIATSLFGAASSSGGGGIFASIGPMITSALGFTGFAAGGQPAMGRISVVGERGPELFVPHTPGTIVPMNKAESMLRGNYVFNINVPAGATRSTIDQTRVKFGLELQNALDRGS